MSISAPAIAVEAPPAAMQGAVSALQGEIQHREQELAQARFQLQQEEREAAQDASYIERLKSQNEGVARDLELQRRLAAAQERAEGLSRRAARRRVLEAELRGARQRLMRACDQALADPAQQLGAAQRLELLRLRALQAEALSAAETPAPVPTLAAAGDERGVDDPQLLRERADLLRDSADKVRRELQRLEQRADELQRRRRLRERAASVDEDLFAEQATSRRGAASADKSRTADAAEAAPGAGGATGVSPGAPQGPAPSTGPFTSSPPAPGRSGLDPATLDLLRRGDSSADPEVKLLSLRRAQSELARMAAELSRRAATLDRRAEELRRRK